MGYNNNNNFNNNNNDDALVAFMVPHETKDGGTYWKATMDLGAGKAVKLVMFENNKEGTKSDYIVKGHKKTYSKERRKSAW